MLIAVAIYSCSEASNDDHPDTFSKSAQVGNERAFVEALNKHLWAVSNRNMDSLKSTMSRDGKMQLILPGSEIIDSVSGFLDFHEAWFQDTSWSFEAKILNTNIGENVGIGITEVMYKEPERDGKPYFNRMIVSYGLEKTDGQWYIIKDHASSIEKSTD